jgi:endonuclease/exonuclease/phosphatase family metal-dependent hydrolase
MRVASFNIHRGLDEHGRPRIGALVEACRAIDADVLGLQEVDRFHGPSKRTDQPGRVARRLGYACAFGPTRRRALGAGYGNALLVRGDIADVATRRLPGTGTRQTRVAVIARVQVAGVGISVAVTHLQHLPRHLRHLADEAPDQLHAVLEWLLERPPPRLLLGDLNLQPPRAEPILAGAGFTIAATGPAYPADEPRLQLDYIAVDGLVVDAAAVAPAAAVSDHRPITAEVRLADREPPSEPD